MNAKELLSTYHNIAVIGVTNDQNKYGYKIFKRLLDLNYTAFGISPKYKKIDGKQIYPDLISIKKPIDFVVFVVNPKFAKAYVEQCITLHIPHIWLQPGTYDDELIAYIQGNNIQYYLNCILVETEER